MSRDRSLTAILAAALLAASLPASVAAQEPFPYDETDLVGIDWTLTSYLGDDGLAEVPEGVTATLRLEDGIASGTGGCNSYSTTYEIEPEFAVWIIRFDEDIVRTMMSCEGPYQEVEDAWLAVLPTIISWSLSDGALRLNDATEDAALWFTAAGAEAPAADLDAIMARLDALSEQVADLQERVTRLEEEASAAG
jgi:heat shock protein HslJ